VADDAPRSPGWRLVDAMNRHLEAMNLGAYVDLFENPWRMIFLNLLGGIFRGLGMALGFFLLSAVVIYVLSRGFVNHLPIVGHFVAQIVRIVNRELALGRGIRGG